MDRTDAELLIASRDDARAFRELYDRWADRLLAYFYRRVLDPEVAADLLAETFAAAFERAHWFRLQAVERKAIRPSRPARARQAPGSWARVASGSTKAAP